jgi:hypothetical protein
MWHVVHFMDDFFLIMFFGWTLSHYEISWMNFHLVKMASIHMIIDKNGLKNMKLEVKTFQFALHVFKIKLWGSLNIERVLFKR